MKRSFISALIVASLSFSGFSYSEGIHQFEIDYTLFHNGDLISSGKASGNYSSPVYAQSQKETSYISSVNLSSSYAGGEMKEVELGTVRSGLTMKASAKFRDGFIYSSIDFSYSILSHFKKGLYGVEYPELNTFSLSQPFFFKSGETRVIDFCMSNQNCGYKLSLQATESKV